MLLKKILFLIFIIIFNFQVHAADTDGVALRSEIYSIPTLTISDKQFLTGDKNGKEIIINGILRFPAKPINEKIPVIFLSHGSGGMGAVVDFWSNHFLSQGYATFSIDSFTGRGITITSTNQAQLGRLNMILDSYKSMEILEKHPRLDSKKFVLMGFSRGGQAALYASLKRFNKMWNKSNTEFIAYIPFYADCVTSYIDDEQTTGKPIQLHHGKQDDYNPIVACKAYVDKLKAAKQNIEIFEYDNSFHTFDSPLGANPPIAAKNAQTVRNCRNFEREPGVIINKDTNQEFKYSDSCVQHDPLLGRNDEARLKAAKEVDMLLNKVFK